MKYQQAYDGDWVQPIMKGWKMRCCDCGLVHTVNIRIVGKKVQIQATRDKKATSNSRRSKKYLAIKKLLNNKSVK